MKRPVALLAIALSLLAGPAVVAAEAEGPGKRMSVLVQPNRPGVADDAAIASAKQRLRRFLLGADLLAPGEVETRFDTARGFLVLPDDHEAPIVSAEAMRAYGATVSGRGLAGYDLETRIVHLLPLDGGLVAALTETRGVAYLRSAPRQPAYHEFRTAWVLRQEGADDRVIYQVEGTMGAIPFLRKVRHMLGERWEARGEAQQPKRP